MMPTNETRRWGKILSLCGLYHHPENLFPDERRLQWQILCAMSVDPKRLPNRPLLEKWFFWHLEHDTLKNSIEI